MQYQPDSYKLLPISLLPGDNFPASHTRTTPNVNIPTMNTQAITRHSPGVGFLEGCGIYPPRSRLKI